MRSLRTGGAAVGQSSACLERQQRGEESLMTEKLMAWYMQGKAESKHEAQKEIAQN